MELENVRSGWELDNGRFQAAVLNFCEICWEKKISTLENGRILPSFLQYCSGAVAQSSKTLALEKTGL